MRSNWTVPGEAAPPERHPEAPAPGEPIPEHWHGCFGCRGTGDGGLGLDVSAGAGAEVTGRIVVDPAFEGGPGVIHGGVLSSVFDEVMGFSARLLAVEVVTAHLEVDYASPVPVGSNLTVRARVDGVLGRKLYASAEVYVDGAETPAGSSRALFITIDHAEHFRDLLGNSTRV
ncbi:PaaI family thioesterase [Tomitella cavernea]|uniref:Acyl-coenzyme A thioesterase THEM4 n=1 Tax=Tomitella cavernea TaxID=1387982 RepID=A0ABP9C963_9ACTN|nr:PaaI family thioesterase [Tomitella cavernea]